MSGKSTALLLAAAALLFVFVWLVERPLRQADLIPPDRRVLPNLDPARITAVDVQPVRRGIIRAEQTNGSWQLTKPISYPADAARVGQLLDKLAHWEWRISIGSDELTNHPDAEEEFGFVPPQFTVALEAGGAQRTLEVGRISALGDEVYLKMRGGYRIFIADAEVLKWLPIEIDNWRDRTVLDVEHTPFQKIVVVSTNASFDGALTLELDPASHLWQMKSPVEARADTAKIAGLLAQLQALQVQVFVPDDALGPESAGLPGPGQTAPLKLTFLRDASATNTAFALEVGASPTNSTNLVFARRLWPANVMEIPKDPLTPWEESYTNFLDPHLTSLSSAWITSIHVLGGDEFTVEKGTNGAWAVHERDETFPADEDLMKYWLEDLTNMAVGVEQMTVANVAAYGLDTPLLRYELHYTEPGNRSQWWTNELRFGTNATGKIYERFEGYKSVHALSPEQFNRMPKFGWQLRDRSVFHFESNEVVAIAVHQAGADRRFIRDAQNQWTLAPTSSGSTTPETHLAIEEALYRMGRTNAVYWDGVGEDHLERFGFGETDYWLGFEIKRDGRMETNTIHFGNRSPYRNPYAYVLRDGRRLIFEFPAQFYDGLLTDYLSIPAAYRPPLKP